MKVLPFETKRQYEELREELRAALDEVLELNYFLFGPQLTAFEQEFAAYLGVKHVVGVASGTSALHLALLACGLERGDEVITAPNSAVATSAGIEEAGGAPVYCDIDADTFNIDPAKLGASLGPKTRFVMPVHLYGRPVDMDAVLAFAGEHGLQVIEDCAQAHGARHKGRTVGTMGRIGCFSFYPTKNLGCMGDGGACATNDDDLADRLRLLRNYGESPEKRFHHLIPGFNSRLSELQAAVLRVKLRHLDRFNARRREIADRYGAGLKGVTIQADASDGVHVRHLYVIRSEQRDALQAHLEAAGVGARVHYPIATHLQEAYAHLRDRQPPLPVVERTVGQILSLPMYPELTDEEVDYVIDQVNAFG